MEIAGRVTKQPPERFDWLFTKRDAYHDPNMLPDLAALQKNVDMTRDLGFVRSALDVKKHADLSIVEEAAKRLKSSSILYDLCERAAPVARCFSLNCGKG